MIPRAPSVHHIMINRSLINIMLTNVNKLSIHTIYDQALYNRIQIILTDVIH